MATHTHSYANRGPSYSIHSASYAIRGHGPFKPKPRTLTAPATQGVKSYLKWLKPDEQQVILRHVSAYPRRTNWLSFLDPEDLKALISPPSPLAEEVKRRFVQVALCSCCPITSSEMHRRTQHTWFTRPFDFEDNAPGFARVDQHSLPLFCDAKHVRFSCAECFKVACPGPSLSLVLPSFTKIETVDFSGIRNARRLALFILALPTHLRRITLCDPGELGQNALDRLAQSGPVELTLLGRAGVLRGQHGFWKAMQTLRKLHIYGPTPADVERIKSHCRWLSDVAFFDFKKETMFFIVQLCTKLARRLKQLTITSEHMGTEMYEQLVAKCKNLKVIISDDTGYELPMEILNEKLDALRTRTARGDMQTIHECKNLRIVEVSGAGGMLKGFLDALFDSCPKVVKLAVKVTKGKLKSLKPLVGLTELRLSAEHLPIAQFSAVAFQNPALEKVKIEARGEVEDEEVTDILECFEECAELKMLEICRFGYTRYDPDSVRQYRDYCVGNYRTRRTHVSVFSSAIVP